MASTTVHKGLTSYWNRSRGYEKLTLGGRRRKSSRLGVVDTSSSQPSGSHQKKRSSWWVKVTRRLKFSKLRCVCSPKKLLCRLRDGYIGVMNRFGNLKVIADGIGGGYAGGDHDGFGTRTLKEYDEKMIIEIYKSIIIAQGQMVPHPNAPKHGS